MKILQMYRTVLIVTMMLVLSSGLGMSGFAAATSPRGIKNIGPGSRRLGRWLVLV